MADPPVTTPLDLLTHFPYFLAVVWFGIVPSIMAEFALSGGLGFRHLYAVPLGIFTGLAFSWLVVYLAALGFIEIGD